MNKNTYLNVLVTVILIVMAVLCFVFVSALDQLRFAMEDMNRSMKNIESRLAGLRVVSGNQPAAANGTGADVANRQYYDQNADQGGRLITAFGADVGNMNMLVTNDAYVSEIWSKTMDSLADRDYADNGSGALKPMLAESWTISPDKLKYRIKLRRGILWHDFRDPVTGKEWKNREVTAHDFKFYLDVVKNEDVDCAPLRGSLKDIDRIDVINDHEFEVIAKQFEEKAGSDYAASRGEYLNGIIMANYLGFPFVDSAEVIRFDKHGEFDADTTNKLMEKKLAELEKAVIPGFYGAYADGKIKTFSRGGSDITGSIVAKAVKADLYENWTDVSGFLVTDPRLIENPETIDVITYRELRELSYMGATVLHEDAIFPVRKAGSPINIRNTNKPEDKGTMIVASTCHKPVYTITGIAGKKGFVAVNIEKDMMNSEIGFGRKVLEEFEKQGISFEHMPSGIDTMSIIVHQDEFEEHEQKVLAGIQRAVHPDVLEVEGDLALVAVVGRAMKSNRGTAARIFAALAHANVNVKMIDQGSSEWNVIVGVRNEDFEKAIKAIYDIFVTTQL